MRVLQVIGVMDRGGAETMVMNLYRAMDRERIQFDFLVHEQREGDYDAEIERLGGRFFRVPRFTGLNAGSYRRSVRALFAEHPEWRVVHGHIGSCAPAYLSEAKRAGAFAIAHSHAQNYVRGLPGLAFNVAAHPVRRVADYFMACSREAGIDRFGGAIVEGERFAIVPNGIDMTRYACDEAVHTQRHIATATSLSLGTVNTAYRALVDAGLAENFSVTPAGFEALSPYKVDNAIIMAAGLSSRFAPLSYEKPKGVLTVRGEVLIERQIRQLREAGITDITVVGGI